MVWYIEDFKLGTIKYYIEMWWPYLGNTRGRKIVNEILLSKLYPSRNYLKSYLGNNIHADCKVNTVLIIFK